MTGWDALTSAMCPAMLAQNINRFHSGVPIFSADYIADLDFRCPYDNYDAQAGSALCTKCWMDFLRGEVK